MILNKRIFQNEISIITYVICQKLGSVKSLHKKVSCLCLTEIIFYEMIRMYTPM